MRTHTSPTKISWESMKQRCNNPHHVSYQSYGGRGVKYDPRWESFQNFLADMGERPFGKTLERTDTNGLYCKSNCTWASQAQQDNNKRNTVIVTGRGKTQSVRDWSTETGLPASLIRDRIRAGWTGDESLNPDRSRSLHKSRKGLNRTGTARAGELNGSVKLTGDSVRVIRELYATGKYTYSDLAESWGVSKPLVSKIVTRKLWRQI